MTLGVFSFARGGAFKFFPCGANTVRILLAILVIAASSLTAQAEDGEIEARLNIRVTDVVKACAYYQWLGFEKDKPCRERGLAILENGSIRLVIWPDGAIDSSGKPVPIRATSLPILIRDYDLYSRSDELKKVGGRALPGDDRASTFCKTLADEDGHTLQLCP